MCFPWVIAKLFITSLGDYYNHALVSLEIWINMHAYKNLLQKGSKPCLSNFQNLFHIWVYSFCNMLELSSQQIIELWLITDKLVWLFEFALFLLSLLFNVFRKMHNFMLFLFASFFIGFLKILFHMLHYCYPIFFCKTNKYHEQRLRHILIVTWKSFCNC